MRRRRRINGIEFVVRARTQYDATSPRSSSCCRCIAKTERGRGLILSLLAPLRYLFHLGLLHLGIYFSALWKHRRRLLTNSQSQSALIREGIPRGQELKEEAKTTLALTPHSSLFPSYSSPVACTSLAPLPAAPSPQRQLPQRWAPFLPLLPLSSTLARPMHHSTCPRRLPLLVQPSPARSSLTMSASPSCSSPSR
jgi:hypothetical protein